MTLPYRSLLHRRSKVLKFYAPALAAVVATLLLVALRTRHFPTLPPLFSPVMQVPICVTMICEFVVAWSVMRFPWQRIVATNFGPWQPMLRAILRDLALIGAVIIGFPFALLLCHYAPAWVFTLVVQSPWLLILAGDIRRGA